MFTKDMLNKDKVFRQIVREVRSEFSSFENLRIVPHEVFLNIICPIVDNVCNKYLGGIDCYYSYFLERAAYDKTIDKVEMDIALFIKEATESGSFSRYKICLSFQGSGK